LRKAARQASHTARFFGLLDGVQLSRLLEF